MDWNHYNVHLVLNDAKQKRCVTAMSKDDAKNGLGIPSLVANGWKITKVIGPLGIHPTTPKQALAHQYRSCIGALKMAEKNIINVSPASKDPRECHKLISIRSAAIKHAQNAMRDTKDLFIKLGLKIK